MGEPPPPVYDGIDPAADGMPGPRLRRSARDWLVDVGMLLIALLLGLLANDADWPQHGEAFHIVAIVLGVACLAALWLRRAHPVGVAVFTALASTVSALGGGAALLALFTVAVHCRPRTIAAVAALSAVTVAVYPAISPGEGNSYGWNDLWAGLLLVAIVIAWGLFVAARRQLVLSLYERARRLESEQRLRVEQARQAERARIAREMHDVLAHRVSLLSVHAGALEFRPDAPPAEIARAAGVIRASAHDALRELREVIGVLRTDDDEETDAALERPQPTLAQLPGLVDESHAAGERPGAGTGLVGLAERVSLAGGELVHGPTADGDFVLRATLPWPT